MPYWFWFIPAGAIVLLSLFVLYRHFFRKKGNCCDGCSKNCNKCKEKNNAR